MLAKLDPEAPLSGVSTLRARVDEALDRWRAPALLAGLLALVTLVLTMGGLYAVLTIGRGSADARAGDSGGPRARETSVRWMVLAEGMWLVRAGALIGLAAAVPLMRLLESQLCDIAPHDATTLAA